jgi:predicted transposase/invertase (TIGR01784 family)
MRAIHNEDILPYLHEVQHVLRLLSKEALHFLEDMLRYVLDNGEGEKQELVIQLFAESVTEEDRGKIMSMADNLRMEGMQEGIQQGMQQGIQQGVQQGRHQEKLAVVKNMLESNISLEVISKATRLPLEEIMKFQIKLH